MSPPLKTIFIGPFVHCKSLEELDICEHGAIGVDEKGVIAFIERDVQGQDADPVSKKHGWVNPKVVKIYDTGFFFPGFIGKLEVTHDGIKCAGRGIYCITYNANSFNRHTHSRFAVPKCRHLRQVDASGLAEYIHISTGKLFEGSFKSKARL
jgi:hypothetical protein